jgi:hypothetical protein
MRVDCSSSTPSPKRKGFTLFKTWPLEDGEVLGTSRSSSHQQVHETYALFLKRGCCIHTKPFHTVDLNRSHAQNIHFQGCQQMYEYVI